MPIIYCRCREFIWNLKKDGLTFFPWIHRHFWALSKIKTFIRKYFVKCSLPGFHQVLVAIFHDTSCHRFWSDSRNDSSTLHREPGWWARSKTRPKKKIRAPHRADSVYYPITCVLVLFCKWQFLGGHQCPSKGSGGDRWDRKWKILRKFDRCIESILLISNNPCFGSILGGTIFRRPQVPFGGVLGW